MMLSQLITFRSVGSECSTFSVDVSQKSLLPEVLPHKHLPATHSTYHGSVVLVHGRVGTQLSQVIDACDVAILYYIS